MSAATLYDAGAPTLEVRVYDHERLWGREFCGSAEDATAVVERWSDVANLFVVADDLSTKHEPDDILAPKEPLIDRDEDHPSTPQPGPIE